jgi:hypothetical protein
VIVTVHGRRVLGRVAQRLLGHPVDQAFLVRIEAEVVVGVDVHLESLRRTDWARSASAAPSPACARLAG